EDSVTAFEGDGRLERLITASGKKIDCDMAVVGVGVDPVAGFTDGSGIAVNDGILVDEYCRTNLEDVYAAGDVARHYHPLADRRLHVEHYQHAALHGPSAALAMLGKPKSYDEVHWFWSDQYEHNLQYTGLWDRWDELVIEGDLSERRFVAVYLQENKVAKAVALGRGEDLAPIAENIRSGMDYERGVLSAT
ncbi:MAG: FAD-dependent oxidoreductase, partial [Actinomycetota bacterium]